jgi:hypothetical protein
MPAFISVSMGTAKHDVTLPSIFLLYKETPGSILIFIRNGPRGFYLLCAMSGIRWGPNTF